ncbi:uncharacterized protein F5Z01DRAFT_416232 [Emericellopsis atlantica]|uniref:Uncharacterized protein n=1 Tax=Emericellopsis atlantica TaxID=2614577 RepID=A0A9P7ZTZ6_9HYPO|nr:uncharacterized protein F5Z01DRAFT_416232 [Emericellopsis atlantica]KAG9257796.1 hypothetical protein F5Z01DRAFT_416232 [Emericellopsis atlantica]
MNHMQVVGTHNSYHIEAPNEEKEVQAELLENAINYWYSHPQLGIQLGDQQMRNLEIDVLADPEGGNYAKPAIRREAGLPYDSDPVWDEPGVKVLHVPDADVHTVCKTLKSCLAIIRDWMDAHPLAVPIPIMMEFKTADRDLGAKAIPWDGEGLLDGLDEEIVEILGRQRLIVPDDLRDGNLTLEESVLGRGWPDLDSARGKIFFLMDNGESDVRSAYIEGRPNLEGRVLFTNSQPGESSCAFQKLNEPNTEHEIANIQEQVEAGYWVRTRADVPMDTVVGQNCSTTQRDNALRSGAHIVSTDFPVYGMSSRWGCDYACRIDGRKAARCNPVNGPKECDDEFGLEPEDYLRGSGGVDELK